MPDDTSMLPPAVLNLRWRANLVYRLANHALLLRDRFASRSGMAALAGAGIISDVAVSLWLRANPSRSAFWPRLVSDLTETVVWGPTTDHRPSLYALAYTLAVPNTTEAGYRAVPPTKFTSLNRRMVARPIVAIGAQLAVKALTPRQSGGRLPSAEEMMVAFGALGGLALGSRQRVERDRRLVAAQSDGDLDLADASTRAELALLFDPRARPLRDLRLLLDRAAEYSRTIRDGIRAQDAKRAERGGSGPEERYIRLAEIAGLARYSPPETWSLILTPRQAMKLREHLGGRQAISVAVEGGQEACDRHSAGGGLALLIDDDRLELPAAVFERQRLRTRLRLPLGQLADVLPVGFIVIALWRLMGAAPLFGGVPVGESCLSASINLVFAGSDVLMHALGRDVSPDRRRRLLLVASWLEGIAYLGMAQQRSSSTLRRGGPVVLAGGSGAWGFTLVASYYAKDMGRVEKTISLAGLIAMLGVAALLGFRECPDDWSWIEGQLPWVVSIAASFFGVHRAFERESDDLEGQLRRGIQTELDAADAQAVHQAIETHHQLLKILEQALQRSELPAELQDDARRVADGVRTWFDQS